MRIVVAHNQYRIPGGEDQVFEDEVRMLEASGHEVIPFVRSNDDFSGLETIRVAAGTVWNRSAAAEIESLVRSFGADIIHVHNWLPQLSPAVFTAARRAGAAVVQTLHNYRYMCAAGTLSRNGRVCEACVGHAVGWSGIRYGCYRGSRAATIPVTAALAVHRRLRTVDRSVDALIVLSEFARAKMIEAGLPRDRLHRKPNFVHPDPGERDGRSDTVLYLGRLVEDKGLGILVDAWRAMPEAPTLRIAGSGPMEARLIAAAADIPNLEFVGLVEHSLVADLLGEAVATIVPSLNYEGFPKVIVESFAVGTPVIASNIGSLTELIDPGRTGYLVSPGAPSAIVETMRDPGTVAALRRMRVSARAEYLNRYTRDHNLARLTEIYDGALRRRRGAPD